MDFRYEDEHNKFIASSEPSPPASNHGENSRSHCPKFDSQLALATSTTTTTSAIMIEKEHMFDKVVTPSDVGKLNRLVIPKQHAEKYFPLDSSANEKGLLLNFEDRTGKPWRFRYSYWNSSQSYVMTKGWSRFVKEKKLDAGDIVSFQRGLGELGKDRLYIDWRRRVVVVNPLSPYATAAAGYQRAAVPWSPMYLRPPQHHLLTHNVAAAVQYFPAAAAQGQYYTNQVRNHNSNSYQYYNSNAVSPPFFYLRTSASGGSESATGAVVAQQEGMVYESVPVLVHGKNVAASAKKLRLFGVNMECGVSSESSDHHRHESNNVNVDAMEVSQSSSSPSTIPFSTLQQSRLYNGIPITQTDFFNNNNKSSSSSMSLDFDI